MTHKNSKKYREKIKKSVGQVLPINIVADLVYILTPEETVKWLITKRSVKEKQQAGQEFPLTEHMKQRERIISIENVAMRALKSELFYKSKIKKEQLYSYFQPETAWRYCIPLGAFSIQNRFSVPRDLNLYCVVIKQLNPEVQFRLNTKEIESVKYMQTNDVIKKIKPQVLSGLPSECHEKVGELIDKTLYLDFDFGDNKVSLRYEKFKDESYISIPSLNISVTNLYQYKPLILNYVI